MHRIDASTPLQTRRIPAIQPARPSRGPERIHKQPQFLPLCNPLSRLLPPTPQLSLVDCRAPPSESLTTPSRRSFCQRIELDYTALTLTNRTVGDIAYGWQFGLRVERLERISQ